MKQLILPLFLFAFVFFSIGVLVGYFAGLNKQDTRPWGNGISSTRQEEFAPGNDRVNANTDNQNILQESRIKGMKTGEARDKRLAEKEHHFGKKSPGQESPGINRRPEKDNPYREKSPSELVSILNNPGTSENRELAMGAFFDLVKKKPLSFIPYLPQISRHGVMHNLCRELVINGGEEGLKAVLTFVSDQHGNIEMRSEAIHSLGDLPPEHNAAGETAVLDLMNKQLPRELQYSVCDAYSRLSKDSAVDNLLGLLDNENCRIRPETIINSAGHAGKPQDVDKLLALLDKNTWTHEMETSILRSAATAGKNGNFLLDLLDYKDQRISDRSIIQAISDSSPEIKLDTKRLISLFDKKLEPEMRGQLARTLIRNSGDEGMNLLFEKSQEPGSSIDADILGSALAEAGTKEDLQAMLDLLPKVKGFDTSYLLSNKIVETSGRNGVESLIDLVEKNVLPERQLEPLCSTIAETGAPEDADRLFSLLKEKGDRKNSRALLKTAYKLSGDNGMEHCLSLLKSARNGDVRATAADIIGHEAPVEHLSELVDSLKSETFNRAQWEISRAVAEAGEPGIKQLSMFLENDQDERRRGEIINCMEEIRKPATVPLLTNTLLKDPSPDIRCRSAEILGNLGNDKAVAALQTAQIHEQDPHVKQAIKDQLDRIRK